MVGGLGDPKLIFYGIWKKAYEVGQDVLHFTRKRLWGVIRIEAIRFAGGGPVVGQDFLKIHFGSSPDDDREVF